MSRGYGRQPDVCKCFGMGYCYKSLSCRSKEAKASGRFDLEARRISKSVVGEEPKKPTSTRFLAWRADGSHEKGPIPAGRVPANYRHLIKD